MGDSADSFLTRQKQRKALGRKFDEADPTDIDRAMDSVRALAQSNKMPLAEAIRYVTGRKVNPYGSPKNQ